MTHQLMELLVGGLDALTPNIKRRLELTAGGNDALECLADMGEFPYFSKPKHDKRFVNRTIGAGSSGKPHP